MKKIHFKTVVIVMAALFVIQSYACGQTIKSAENYLKELPHHLKLNYHGNYQKYKMTAVYINKDLSGNFMNKTGVTGEYTCGLEGGRVKWNNVYLANSDSLKKAFPKGFRQDYIEGMEYIPTSKMMETTSFEKFPTTPDGVFTKNLIWDMMALEMGAWNYFDTLQLNQTFTVPGAQGKFAMADIGDYEHSSIQICWTGLSMANGKICAIIEFKALNNKIDLNMPGIKSKGSEIYWGNILVSLEDKQIEHAVMYSNTLQDLKIAVLPQNLIINTMREVNVEKIP